MIKNYRRFINENIHNNLFFISIELKNILLSMDNSFANALLNLEYCTYDILKNNTINYLDIDGSLISYLPHLDNYDSIIDYYKSSKRMSIKPTKILKKIVKNENDYLRNNGVSQKDIELFINKFKPMKNDVVEWFGDDILKAFNYTGLLRSSFSLSCANFDQKRLTGGNWEEPKKEWFDIYTKNPNNVSVVVVLDNDGSVIGRRMVFFGEQYYDSIKYKKGDSVGIGSHFYGEQGRGSKIDILLMNYIKNKGYELFDSGNYGNISIQLKNYKFPQYPPFDNFYINVDNGVISYPSFLTRDGGRWSGCYKLSYGF